MNQDLNIREDKSFEEAISQLEQIVSRLEKGDISLEESITNFQQGIELSRYCAAKLDEAEKKISILLQDEEGNLIEKDFEL
ncbi:exodeoxyribonuclease VII small subunit [Ruminiclostridium cellobioparum]|jgi:exodeoxyribonuclease VII small subunit|uniref:Exodeoxyribonuclease 7 small subunit n=1 Tax=Ruminiclostridium cellobioparum subsp. termitidis CT1112 TaxID=1195236 RepID=S0FRY4_RUMCE|nr:exodeoxyribonuclease VII small subunit [Ruminiclostridium cellobioparum]EMS71929.1 exodeoxyribonuclease VII, small subunit [Ruminiclostridium cellobioparum subsp. termitidis CT1112]